MKKELLKQGNYLTVIKPLAHYIGLEETIILMELIGMEEYKKEKHHDYKEFLLKEGRKINPNKMDFYEEDRFFVCTTTELELATTIKEKKQTRLLNKLKDINLLKVESRGLPARRFIQLNHDEIEKIFEQAINNYRDFKEKFFKEKKEYIQKKMSRKSNPSNVVNIQFRQNDGTDNIKGLDIQNTSKPQSIQFRQNDGTSSVEMTEQVPSNEGTLNNNNSLIISNSNNIEYPNLNLNLNPIETLWNAKIPMYLKQRIKIRIYDNKLSLSDHQILEIEEAYHYQIQKGYIKPNCDKNDSTAINDYEFSMTVIKMLDTVQDIQNMRGLIQKWVHKAYDYKTGNIADSLVSFYNWLELNEELNV